MLKIQAVANSARQGIREFFNIEFFNIGRKNGDWRYLPMNSLLPPIRVREVRVSRFAVGNGNFLRYDYEQKPVRSARARV